MRVTIPGRASSGTERPGSERVAMGAPTVARRPADLVISPKKGGVGTCHSSRERHGPIPWPWKRATIRSLVADTLGLRGDPEVRLHELGERRGGIGPLRQAEREAQGAQVRHGRI